MIMFFDKDSFKLGKIKKLKELILKKKQKKNNLERELKIQEIRKKN